MNKKIKDIKKIAYVTGSRADYGLMKNVLRGIEKSPCLKLGVLATGMHLMPEFGSTINEVRAAFPKTTVIASLFSREVPEGMAVFASSFLKKIVNHFIKNKPDLVLLLGDRVEMLVTATACLYLGIPVAHVHGGDRTTTVDDAARQAISKLAHLHFPATNQAAKRLVKMGEEPHRIIVVGAPGLDEIKTAILPSKKELQTKLGIPSGQYILLTQHPVSQTAAQSAAAMRTVLTAAFSSGLPVVIIYPNADTGGRAMIREIEKYKKNSSAHIFPSVLREQFLALERDAAVWIGNSSAQIIESGSFKIPVVNIGDRQKGREHGPNIISVPCEKKVISQAIVRALSKKFRARIIRMNNCWGDGATAPRIVKALEKIVIDSKFLSKNSTY